MIIFVVVLSLEVPRDRIFIEENHTEVGFTKLFEDKVLNSEGLSKLSAPKSWTFKQWWTWINSTGDLTPKNNVFIIRINSYVFIFFTNQGVLQLGGMFALFKDTIVYSYEEVYYIVTIIL